MAPTYLDRRTLSGGIVNPTVGKSEVPFDIQLSSYVADRQLVFPSDEPNVFADFVSWLYCGNISTGPLKSSQTLHLFQLWTLAERFQVAELQDLALAQIKEVLADRPRLRILKGSALRLLAVDTWAARASKLDVQLALKSIVMYPTQLNEDLKLRGPMLEIRLSLKLGKQEPADTGFPATTTFHSPILLIRS
ncbi:hypothetical protein BDW74DRAFT_174328 [Aspergillus multicolor]|uniref:uncharacterized protein n=1 Tax=Aspergillus multicolor TaxID=41759 RepID=UPI003CCE2A02